MQRPFRVSPILQFLALRAIARVCPPSANLDPWCGAGVAAARAMADGPDRRPGAWLSRWPHAAVDDFWRGTQTQLLQQFKSPAEGMGELVVAQNAGRKNPMGWGEWGRSPDAILMGLKPPMDSVKKVMPLPPGVRVAGIIALPSELEGVAKEVLGPLRDHGREGWWVVPAQPSAWDSLSLDHYLLAHRLGVSMWLEAPAQSAWAAYTEALCASARLMSRFQDWEQWVWPVCDLIEQGFEETLLLGSPTFKAKLPWKWEGKARNPDWAKTGRVVWDALEQSLGGTGALNEILVANSLWREKLLVRQ